MLYPLSRINRLAINSSFLTSSWITRSLIIFSVAVNLKSCVTLSESFHSCVASAALCGNWQLRKYWQNRKPSFPLPGTSASSACPILPLCCLENTYPDRWLLVCRAAHAENQRFWEVFYSKNLLFHRILAVENIHRSQETGGNYKPHVLYRLFSMVSQQSTMLGDSVVLFLYTATELLFMKKKKGKKIVCTTYLL